MVLLAIILALVLFAITDKGQAQAAPLAAVNRCPTTVTANSVAYNCWAAYPEAFYAAGLARSRYRLSWRISCGRQSVHGSKTVEGGFKLIVNQFTELSAYQLMISSDVCKIDVIAKRVAGNESIYFPTGLVINQQHAPPVHN